VVEPPDQDHPSLKMDENVNILGEAKMQINQNHSITKSSSQPKSSDPKISIEMVQSCISMESIILGENNSIFSGARDG
jgi:hypothetical protein